MPTITQMLRDMARSQRSIPFWALEKDYALSYLLAGMAQSEKLYRGLVLKGGTALRKYYFADYRFSEDLDFSAYPATRSADVEPALQTAVRTMNELLQERGAFRVELERLVLREPHPGGQDAFTVRVQFPAHREPMCRLKVEITYDELLLWPPQPRTLAWLSRAGACSNVQLLSPGRDRCRETAGLAPKPCSLARARLGR